MTDTLEEQTFDLKPLLDILEEYKNQKGAIIPILQRTQAVYGYLPKPILKEISKRMRIPISRILGGSNLLRPISSQTARSASDSGMRWHSLSCQRSNENRRCDP